MPFHHGSGINPEIESSRLPNCCTFMENGTGFHHQLEFYLKDTLNKLSTLISFGAKLNLVHDY